MTKRIQVKLVPSVQYGKLSMNAQPICPLGNSVLAGCKVQFGYKPKMVKGNEVGRTTFAPEWVDFLTSTGIELVINEVPSLPAYNVGDTFGKATEQFDFESLF